MRLGWREREGLKALQAEGAVCTAQQQLRKVGSLRRRAVSLTAGFQEPCRETPVSEHGTKPQRVTPQEKDLEIEGKKVEGFLVFLSL